MINNSCSCNGVLEYMSLVNYIHEQCFFSNLRLHQIVWSRWDSNVQPSDLWANT